MKSGIKTTEFWALLAGLGAIFYNFAHQNCDLSPAVIVALGGTLMTYIGGRTWLKKREMELEKNQ